MKIYAFADEADAKIDGQIAAMKRNRLNGLEIRGVDGENISDITPEKAKEVRKKLEDNGLIVWSLGSPIGKIKIEDDFAAHLEKLKHTLEIGNLLGAENIRLFSFYLPEGSDFDAYADEVLNRVRQLAECAVMAGISPCHENEKGIFGDSIERCLTLYESLPLLQGVFDPANFVQCGVDAAVAWKMLKPYIKYLHIKDALPDGAVVPAGKGAGHLAEIVKEYAAFGGQAVTIEPHLAVFDGLKELEQSGNTSDVGGYRYPNNQTAFDAACEAFQKLFEGKGQREKSR